MDKNLIGEAEFIGKNNSRQLLIDCGVMEPFILPVSFGMLIRGGSSVARFRAHSTLPTYTSDRENYEVRIRLVARCRVSVAVPPCFPERRETQPAQFAEIFSALESETTFFRLEHTSSGGHIGVDEGEGVAKVLMGLVVHSFFLRPLT